MRRRAEMGRRSVPALSGRFRVGTRKAAANSRLMGAATSIPPADVATSLQSFVSVFVGIYILLLIVYILLSSWIQLPYSRTVEGVQQFLEEICRPYLRLFQGRLPTLGPLDFSPLIAIFVLIVAMILVNRLIGAIL